ncbi:hypothetical protein PGB90_005917 [Kerria lacca]
MNATGTLSIPGELFFVYRFKHVSNFAIENGSLYFSLVLESSFKGVFSIESLYF